MRLVVHLEYVFHRKLRVTLRRGDAFVAEQLLNRAQVCAFLQHVRAEGMAKCVRVNVRRKSFGDGNLLNDAPDAARGETSPTPVDQQGGCVLTRLAESLLPGRKINRERTLHRIPKGNVAFLLPFAADKNRLRTQADVVDIDSGQFRVADAASVQQFEHEMVALRESRYFWHLTVEH